MAIRHFSSAFGAKRGIVFLSLCTGSNQKGGWQAAEAYSHWSRAAGTPVEAARSLADETVLESGPADGDVAVTSGHLLHNNSSRVSGSDSKAGA
jgi:hypothetical protein